jgi:hypothetical protein
MPTQITLYGTPGAFALDPSIPTAPTGFTELDALVITYRQRFTEYQAAGATADQAENELAAAPAADRQARAHALRKSEPDPGPQHVQSAESALAEAREQAAVLHEALLLDETAIREHLAQRGAEYLAAARKRHTTEEVRYRKAVSAWLGKAPARTDLVDASSLVTYLSAAAGEAPQVPTVHSGVDAALAGVVTALDDVDTGQQVPIVRHGVSGVTFVSPERAAALLARNSATVAPPTRAA